MSQTMTQPAQTNSNNSPVQLQSLTIGVVGENGSGKSTVCNILQKHHFNIISLSDIVRKQATLRNRDHSRDSLTETANELKAAEGSAVLAIKSVELANSFQSEADYKRTVFDSIRNKEEVDYLKSQGIYLIGIQASLESRFERIKERQRESDHIDFETFKKQCMREYEGQSSGQNIKEALNACDEIISNDGTQENLEEKILEILKKLEK